MKAACGCYHTVTIDHNENVWSFGTNNKGALGIEEVSEALSPQKVPLLQSIVSVACGVYHTCCLDSKGMVWTFGENSNGELGRTGNPRIPTQVEGMPPISTITCGQFQTICSTNTLSLWAFGQNGNGELGLGHSNHQKTPAQIPMDNISSVAIGQYHSLFLHQNGTVFASGYNSYGVLGLGHTNQVTSPQQIPNFQKIIQIATKHLFSLFLSEEGKVFACGYNGHGQYGNVGSCTSPTQVPELPEIQRIFVGYHSSYLIDKKGSLWVIGHNANGELGIGNNTNQKVPVLNANIQNINFISAGHHTIVKCNSGELYVFGQNNCGQLGLGNKTAVNMPTAHPKPNICSEIDSKEIMKSKEVYSMLEALIKLQESGCGWSSTDIEKVMNLQNLTTKSNTAPPTGWKSWREAFQFLQNKIPQITKMISEQKKISQVRNEQLKKMEVELEILLQKIEETKNEIRTFDKIIDLVDEPISQLQNLEASVQQLAQEEDKMLGQFTNLLKTKRIEDLSAAEMEIVLWRMGLSHCASLFVANEIDGNFFGALNQDLLRELGLSRRDSCMFVYYRELIQCRGFLNPEIAGQNAEECVVCFHDSPVKTLELLQEYGIELDKNVIVDHCWTAPLLIYLSDFGEEFKNLSMRERIKISGVMNQWKELHRLHLASLK